MGSPVRGGMGHWVWLVAIEVCFDMNELPLLVQGALFPLFIVLGIIQFIDFCVKGIWKPLGE